MYNKDKGVEKDLWEILQLCVCNEKWWVFDSSLPVLSTNWSRRTTFISPREESCPYEAETRHCNS